MQRSRRLTLLGLPILLGLVWVVPSWDYAASGFFGEDDWYFLNLVSDLTAGSPGALGRLLEGGGRRLWRPVPGLIWLLEWALHGLDPRPYYALNQVVGALLVAGVASFAGRLTLAAPGPPVGRLHLAVVVAVAGTVAGCAKGPHDARTFLAARDDLFAAAFVVLALSLWLQEERRARILAHGALLLAVFSKPTAAAALPLVVALDAVVGRLPRSPRRLALRYGGLALGAAAYAGLTGSFWRFQADFVATPSWNSARSTLGFVGRQLAYGDADRHAPTARTVLLLTVAGTSLVAGRWSLRVVAFGLVWMVLGAALPVAFYLDAPSFVQGRYVLLSSLGAAVAISGLVGPGIRWRQGAIAFVSAALMAVAMLGAWSAWLRLQPARPPDQASAELPAALSSLLAAAPEADGVAFAAHEVTLGLVGLFTSHVLPETVEGMKRPPRVWLEGGAVGFGPAYDPGSAEIGERRIEAASIDLDALVADPRTLVVYDGGGSDGSRFRALTSLPPPRSARSALPDWHWGKLEAMWGGSVLTSPSGASEQIRPPHLGLDSPPLQLDPSEVCGLVLQFDPLEHPTQEPPAWNPLLDRSAYALLSWASSTVAPWDRFAVACLPLDGDIVRFDLRNSPGWRTAGTVDWLVLGQVSAGDLQLRRVALEGCAGSEAAPDRRPAGP
jgi:hypothetical protein